MMMRRRRLFWQIFPAFLLVSALTLAAAGAFVLKAVTSFHIEQVRDDLEARARLLVPQARGWILDGQLAEMDGQIGPLAARTGTRITIVDADGRVLAESDATAALMESHADRDEVREALAGGVGRSIRSSDTVQAGLVYVAVAIEGDAGAPLGVVRTALPLTDVHAQLATLRRALTATGLAAVLLGALLSWWIARRLSRPLEAMRHAAERYAGGDLQAPMPRTSTLEIAALADSVRTMARQLTRRAHEEARLRNEKQSVLSSMSEGVVAVDGEARVIEINQAAVRLLAIDQSYVAGRSIQETIRNAELQRFILRALQDDGTLESDIEVHGEARRHLRATGTPMRDANGRPVGAVVVLHDMTRMRRLEQVRRVIVANVSHELRTPITSIKKFEDTMLEAPADPDGNERFLRIIARQADRLNAIIEDLLALARIEDDQEHGGLRREPVRVEETLAAVVQVCRRKAEDKGIRLVVECDGALVAPLNGALIEQAVVNLVDNAIKYSEAGGTVWIGAAVEEGRLSIAVRDEGCGIEARHLPRLFERFYRVDKARSRKLGGTGLGLAIVKHIAEGHGGEVCVESTPGRGSTFRLQLPLSPSSSS